MESTYNSEQRSSGSIPTDKHIAAYIRGINSKDIDSQITHMQDLADKMGISISKYYSDIGEAQEAYTEMWSDCVNLNVGVVLFKNVYSLGNSDSEVNLKVAEIEKLPRCVVWWFMREDITTEKDDYAVKLLFSRTRQSFEETERKRNIDLKHRILMHSYLDANNMVDEKAESKKKFLSKLPEKRIALYIRADNHYLVREEEAYYRWLAQECGLSVVEVYSDYAFSKESFAKIQEDSKFIFKGNTAFHGLFYIVP